MIQATGTARATGSPSLLGLDKQGRKHFCMVRKEGNASQACLRQVHSLLPHSTSALGYYSLMPRQQVDLRSPCVHVSMYPRRGATGGHCPSVTRACKITLNSLSFFFFLSTRILTQVARTQRQGTVFTMISYLKEQKNYIQKLSIGFGFPASLGRGGRWEGGSRGREHLCIYG